MRTYNVKEDLAGLVMGVVTILDLIGPIGGGRMLLASVSVASAVVFLFLVLLAVYDITNKNLMIFCAIIMPLHSICSGMAFPAAGATSQNVVPARLKGLAWGVGIAACFVLGGAWGPLMVGGISDAYGGGYKGLALGFAAAGLFGLLASWLFFKTSRHVANDMKKAKTAV